MLSHLNLVTILGVPLEEHYLRTKKKKKKDFGAFRRQIDNDDNISNQFIYMLSTLLL